MAVTKFVEHFASNLNEDVGERANHSPTPANSKVEGRVRMKNAARIAIDRIETDPQHREHFDEASIEQLAGSIKQHGQLQPIRVRYDDERGVYILIAGERRLRAMKHAGITEADCVIAVGELTDSQILTQQILENCQREDLKPIERANAFSDLMKQQDWDQTRLASELHVSKATVSNALKLLRLDDDTQKQIEIGVLNSKTALAARRKSRTTTKSKARKPRPKNFRVPSGKVLVEPRMKKSYIGVLEEALEAARSTDLTAKAA